MNNKKNVVFITIDECKASALGCYENPVSHTPHINKLAEQGALFRNTFTSMPKCVPSRAGMMTGRYAHVDGHRTIGLEIEADEHTIFKDFKKNGYITAMFGKNSTVKNDAIYTFFDECRSNYDGIKLNTKLKDHQSAHLHRALYRDEYYDYKQLPDYFALQDACQFVERKKDTPFFLLYNIAMPHPVYVNVEPFVQHIDETKIILPKKLDLENCPPVLKNYRETYNLEMLTDSEWKKLIRAYYSMLSFSDYCVGKLLDKLQAEGLTENTLIILTSDHGDFNGEHGCVEKWDTLFYDCLIKVPLIMKLPGVIKENILPSSFVENIDIMPTILDLCQLSIPHSVQGQSMKPALEDVELKVKEHVFAEGGLEQSLLTEAKLHKNRLNEQDLYYTKQQVMINNPKTMFRAKMIRTEKWKFIYRLGKEHELYNLEEDPFELKNLVTQQEYNALINQFKTEILDWLITHETNLPEIKKLQA